MRLKNKTLRRSLGLLCTLLMVGNSIGCATMAHRSSYDGQLVRHTADCAGEGETCPWMVGNALLLLPGVVPGVIAFAVDFSNGSWNHHNLHGQDTARPDNRAWLTNYPD